MKPIRTNDEIFADAVVATALLNGAETVSDILEFDVTPLYELRVKLPLQSFQEGSSVIESVHRHTLGDMPYMFRQDGKVKVVNVNSNTFPLVYHYDKHNDMTYIMEERHDVLNYVFANFETVYTSVQMYTSSGFNYAMIVPALYTNKVQDLAGLIRGGFGFNTTSKTIKGEQLDQYHVLSPQ